MRGVAREVGFAVLSWLLPLVAAMAMFAFRDSRRPLFESLIAVALAASTVLLGALYFRGLRGHYIWHGARIGLIWMGANWALDALMFSGGPMKMSPGEYVQDIGLTYLMIPLITLGLGIVAASKAGRGEA